jgi:hypothetical protein
LKRELWATSNAFLDETPTAIFIRQVLGTDGQPRTGMAPGTAAVTSACSASVRSIVGIV